MEKSKYYLGIADWYNEAEITWPELIEKYKSLSKPLAKEDQKASGLDPLKQVVPKFLRDPMMALMDACGFAVSAYYKKPIREEFLREVIFDPESKTYIYNRFLTLRGWKPLTQEQLEKFKAGEFKVYYERFEANVLSTELEELTGEEAKALEESSGASASRFLEQ